ncbi:hypothetical protein KFK09_007043 [Dendrobium nobile]|uniref:Reverse transcriptase domain-containing protein n=1 Tax=Dendrobium nobile TaxID=94219 RepID=A0A8T3BQW2_DENNO|nr:hypothetical protein KFK09_007043 [Dendrobium nobile]
MLRILRSPESLLLGGLREVFFSNRSRLSACFRRKQKELGSLPCQGRRKGVFMRASLAYCGSKRRVTVSNTILPSNYRPISLCNTVYKVVARVILNRIVVVIPKLISKEQVTFIKGRKDVKGVKNILYNFYEWTSQRINKSKSAMLFGKHVGRKKKKSISRIMGFQMIEECLRWLEATSVMKGLARFDYTRLLRGDRKSAMGGREREKGALKSALVVAGGLALAWVTMETAFKPWLDRLRSSIARSDPAADPDDADAAATATLDDSKVVDVVDVEEEVKVIEGSQSSD